MKNNREAFLDTTIHFEKFSVEEERREEIHQLLAKFGFLGTSTYTFLEFKGSFLQDLAYLYKYLRKETLDEFRIRLSKLPVRQHRKLTMCLNHLARFGVGSKYTEEEACLLIENVMDHYWEEIREVDHIEDGTGCIRAKEGPKRTKRTIDVTISQCRRNKIQCKIHQFFKEHLSLFEKIYSEIEALPESQKTEELRKFQEIFQRAKTDPAYLCDSSICRTMGDVLIAVDGRNFSTILSTNKREFEVLCKALGKKLEP